MVLGRGPGFATQSCHRSRGNRTLCCLLLEVAQAFAFLNVHADCIYSCCTVFCAQRIPTALCTEIYSFQDTNHTSISHGVTPCPSQLEGAAVWIRCLWVDRWVGPSCAHTHTRGKRTIAAASVRRKGHAERTGRAWKLLVFVAAICAGLCPHSGTACSTEGFTEVSRREQLPIRTSSRRGLGCGLPIGCLL